MKRLIIAGVSLLLIAACVFIWWQRVQTPSGEPRYVIEEDTARLVDSTVARATVVAENLQVPWELLFLPDGRLLVTERPGTLLLLDSGTRIPVPGVVETGEGGLLGAALHPDFNINQFMYLYQTTETSSGLRNRVVRYVFNDDSLELDQVILDDLPGARYHDGGRIEFGPDGYLYVTLGDATNEASAQDTENLAGSILRVTADGDIPASNPFANAVYSYGHRNPQGLAWDGAGNLWSSEHGRSGARSGYDEINLILPGNNYGWPEAEGDEELPGADGPIRHSGAATTWAPGDLAYLDGVLYMPGLRGQTLCAATLEGREIVAWNEYFVGDYGRLRSVVAREEEGLLYLTTSNRDGRGIPADTDDRIIRINPDKL